MHLNALTFVQHQSICLHIGGRNAKSEVVTFVTTDVTAARQKGADPPTAHLVTAADPPTPELLAEPDHWLEKKLRDQGRGGDGAVNMCMVSERVTSGPHSFGLAFAYSAVKRGNA